MPFTLLTTKGAHRTPPNYSVVCSAVLSGSQQKKKQMLQPYLIERLKNRKWYKKMFKRLLNDPILNSCILLDKSSANQIKQQAFRLELVDAIIKEHLPFVPQHRRQHPNQNAALPSTRLIGEQHFIVRSEVVDGPRTTSNGSKGRHYCRWCSIYGSQRRGTVYKCEKCDIHLCLEGCFKKFHTLP